MTSTTTPKVKLTKTMRDTFVAAVLKDIDTRLDTDTISKLVMDEAIAALPPAVRKIYQDPATQYYVYLGYAHLSGVRRKDGINAKGHRVSRSLTPSSISVPACRGSYSVSEKTQARITKILQDCADRMDEKEAMQERLTAMAGACNNVAELEDMFPLLAKYIPKPVIVPKSMVPAVQIKDTMAQLRKLGVPPKMVKA